MRSDVLVQRPLSAPAQRHKSKEPASIIFVGVFYTVLVTMLFNHNNETTKFGEKMAAFFVYGMCGIVTLITSLIYHNKYMNWTHRELFKYHMTKGKWRYTTSFPFAITAFLLFLGLNKGDMDRVPSDGFWNIVGKVLLNIVIILTSLDLNSAKNFYSQWREKHTLNNNNDTSADHSELTEQASARVGHHELNENFPVVIDNRHDHDEMSDQTLSNRNNVCVSDRGVQTMDYEREPINEKFAPNDKNSYDDDEPRLETFGMRH